jgi:hypothetical protein
MKSALLRIVVCAISLVLALPPGWCGTFLPHDRAEPAPVQGTCCHRTAQGSPPEPKQPPARQTVECCCQRDATVPEKPVQTLDAPALALPLLADTSPGLVEEADRDTASFLLQPGPRLHVLQCVWRC